MTFRYRLFLLLSSLIILFIIGRIVTGSFQFALHDIWFTSGIFLVILISLIDQPHFSKDANVFLNSITAGTTLLLFSPNNRTPFWYSMLCLIGYLILSSYMLMWLRKYELKKENKIIRLATFLNREIGKPTVLFSVFFIWGIIEKFGYNSVASNALLLFWSIFILLNIPGIAQMLSSLFEKKEDDETKLSPLISITNPLAAFINLDKNIVTQIGTKAVLFDRYKTKIAYGILVDDRIIAGNRIGKVKIQKLLQKESVFCNSDYFPITTKLDSNNVSQSIISVVDIGTSIGKVQFFVNPSINIEEGELVWVQVKNDEKAYYQVVYEEIVEEKIEEKNEIQYVKVIAGQLGFWDNPRSRFEQMKIVASAGEVINRVIAKDEEIKIPEGHKKIGIIPNSKFPIHVNIDDIITHNTAILGVTGSGKSYLSFSLIESFVEQKVKVLILDPSRQHFSYLSRYSPTQLRDPNKIEEEVKKWMEDSESFIGIHQFATQLSMPRVTSCYVQEVFKWIVQTVRLSPGKNERAHVCIVFEEAHSLIPEWNQVSERNDTDYVNRTARVILQGRKFGVGSLIITQRTANVTKTILNQCNSIIALQSFDQTGLDFLKNYMGDEYSNSISTLPLRHAILVGKASSSSRPVIFKIDDLDYEEKPPPIQSDIAFTNKG